MPGRFRAHETERTPIRYACSFCGKNQEQVRRLIAGPGSVFICDECVSLCQEIISEEFGGSQPAQQPTASAESQPAISGKPELHAPTPTPCPECKSERLLAEAANNVRLVALDSGLRGGFSAHTELWAIVCPNCGHTTLYAKKPDKLTR